jgi:hypothetical protein
MVEAQEESRVIEQELEELKYELEKAERLVRAAQDNFDQENERVEKLKKAVSYGEELASKANELESTLAQAAVEPVTEEQLTAARAAEAAAIAEANQAREQNEAYTRAQEALRVALVKRAPAAETAGEKDSASC